MFHIQLALVIVYIILCYKCFKSDIPYKKGEIKVSNLLEIIYITVIAINTLFTTLGSLLIIIYLIYHLSDFINLLNIHGFYVIKPNWIEFFFTIYFISFFFSALTYIFTQKKEINKVRDYYIKQSAYLTIYEIYSKLEGYEDDETITISQLKHEIMLEKANIKNRNQYKVDNYFIIQKKEFYEFKKN